MAWDPTGVGRGALDRHGCNVLKALTYGEPGRHGPRAKSVSLGADPEHASDWGNSISPVTAPTLLRQDRERDRDPIPRNGFHDST